jgi:hypothetical protein
VLDSAAVLRGNVIYTSYRLKVTQKIKGQAGSTMEVLVPGGTLNNLRQSFAGSPTLDAGSEYVIFVWTSPRGLNHVLGMAQGVFDVKVTSEGETLLVRGPADAQFVNASGLPVTDEGAKITLRRLTERVQAVESAKQ